MEMRSHDPRRRSAILRMAGAVAVFIGVLGNNIIFASEEYLAVVTLAPIAAGAGFVALMLAWLSVEFEEICTIDGKVTRKSHKIEGYVKPVISKPTSDPIPISEQAAPEQPLPAAQFR